MKRTITRDQLDKAIRKAATSTNGKPQAQGRWIFIGLVL
jgi:hypothetical protein